MNGPECESDNLGGIKFGEESGAKLGYPCIAWTTKIPHSKNFLKRFSCNLSLPKKIRQLAHVRRIFPIKFQAYQDHTHDSIIIKGWRNWCCLDNIRLKQSNNSSHDKFNRRKI